MQLFCLENLSAQLVSPKLADDILNLDNPRPEKLTKEAFREWCVSSATKGLFYSVWSGAFPHSRVNQSNPATLIHGIVGDYDSSAAESKIAELPNVVGILPNFISSTFSEGKVRLVWAFEEPVLVGDSALTELFLKEMDEKIRFTKALPGFDKTSVDPKQYFEQGTNWRSVTGVAPVATATLNVAMIHAAGKLKGSRDIGAIPMDKVAAEVERQFPGRWKKAFEIGQRGPLFWIPDGIDREGCVVTEHGMVSYSDRAESNFLPWSKVLGGAFVKEFETEIIGATAGKYYYDGRQYYRKVNDNWVAVPKDDARLQLRVMGIAEVKRKGQSASDQDLVLNHIQTHRRIYAAVPIPFNDSEIVPYNGNKLLNTSNHRIVQPAPEGEGKPEKFPWIWNWINNAFDEGPLEGSLKSKDYFCGWLWRFYSSALRGDVQAGQILVMVGPTSVGKSFINQHLIGGMVGGSVEAQDILLKGSTFNKSAGEVGHWRLDDPCNEGSFADKRRFTHNLKQHAANPTLTYQPKYVDAMEVPFMGRICVTLNDNDPEALAILPAMDASFQDKIILLKLRGDFSPDFLGDNSKNEARMALELPFFLRWLLDWGENLPEGLQDKRKPRFGIKAFHHPDLVEKSRLETPEYAIQELLEIWCVACSKNKDAPTELTASAILQELRSLMPDSTRELKIQTFGRNLTKLVGHYRRLKGKRSIDGVAHYKFEFPLCRP